MCLAAGEATDAYAGVLTRYGVEPGRALMGGDPPRPGVLSAPIGASD